MTSSPAVLVAKNVAPLRRTANNTLEFGLRCATCDEERAQRNGMTRENSKAAPVDAPVSPRRDLVHLEEGGTCFRELEAREAEVGCAIDGDQRVQ